MLTPGAAADPGYPPINLDVLIVGGGVQGLWLLNDLRRQGYSDNDLRAVLDPGGIHNESAWSRRLPDALRFLLRA